MSYKEFIRKSQFPLLLALGTYPLGACVAGYITPQLLPYMWMYSLGYAVFAVVSLLLPAKPRFVFGVLGATLLLLPGMTVLAKDTYGVPIAVGILYSALLFWSLLLPSWEAERELGGGWIGGGFVILLLGYFVATAEDRIAPAALGIKVALLVFVVLAMLSMNRGSLNLAAVGSRGFTASMQRKNLLLLAGMFGIALLVGLIPSLVGLVRIIVQWIAWLVAWLQKLLASDQVPETTAETTVEATVKPTMENWMDIVSEGKDQPDNYQKDSILMTAIVIIVLIPCLIVLMYKLGKLAVKGIRLLVQWIDHTANAQTADFVDEITDIREESEREILAEQKEDRKRNTVFGKLTPTQRIRRRYRRLQEKHPEWKRHQTARETLPEDAAKLYERARYSDHPITAGDADQFREKTK